MGPPTDPIEKRLRNGSGGGTHMALLRGSGDQSWLLHWHSGVTARLWRVDSMQNSSLGRPSPTSRDYNVFCAGQATRKDGRLMVVGGTEVGITGEARVGLFDATSIDGPSGGWFFAESTKFARYYGTVTTLGDGRMLATAGTQHLNLVMFGGRETDGTESLMDDARVLNLGKYLNWETDQTSSTYRPSPRHGHSAVFNWHSGRTVFFGGAEKVNGQDSPLNDVRQLFIQNTVTGFSWAWQDTTSPPTLPDPVTGLFPPPRRRHTAVIVDSAMIVYGGLGQNDVVLMDVWRLVMSKSSNQWIKEADGPGPRYGHTAVVDNALRAQAEMLVHGGLRAVGSYAADTVWRLTLDRADRAKPLSWQALTITGGPPAKREGHVAVMDTTLTDPAAVHRMVVFGGERQTLGQGNDVWVLSRAKSDLGFANLTWDSLAPPGARPGARKRAMGIYDHEWKRLLVFGGDTTTAAGGESNHLWGLKLDLANQPWQALWQGGTPAARTGAAVVFDPRGVQAKVPERFDAAASPKWQQFSSDAKWQANYPFMHQLQNGMLLFAGNNGPGGPNNTLSWTFNPAAPPGQAWSNQAESEFLGGSAVLTYAPSEQVMKSGAGDHHNDTPMSKKTRAATVLPFGITTWINAGDLPEDRRFPNLTIVPDGRVLVTGGWKLDSAPSEAALYSRNPYFYSNGSWGSPLANDLVGRGYHASALLLPDARILCAGGPPLDDTLSATIFTPPYLYQDGTTLAARPWIVSTPSVVHYGEPFYVGVNGATAKKIVSLIRPGATTHGFDQNQRYVQLAFTKYVADKWLRSVLPDSNTVPPGDYLLFVVDSTAAGNVPSVGKWVRIESQIDATAPQAAALSITDLTQTSLNLRWTAPGDDGTSGTATEYELRRRVDTPITEANFSSCDPVSTAPPRPAGSQEQVSEIELISCKYYWYGLRTRDERTGVWSPLTIISLLTLGCTGGGGGAGELPPSARPVEGAAQVALDQALRLGPLEDGVAAVSLTHAGRTAIRLDSVRVVGVARGDDSLAVLANGAVSVGVRRVPVRIDGRQGEITAAALALGYQTTAGESLVVQFPGGSAEALPAALVIGTAGTRAEAPIGGFRVLEPSGSGAWYASASALPGPGDGEIVVKDIVSDRVCLVFRGDHTVRSIARVIPEGAPAALQELRLVQADHARLGPITDASQGIVLEPGERIVLSFMAPEGTRAPRDAFLLFRVSSATASPMEARTPSRSGLPTALALGQNEPNPFGEGTVIRFALPARSLVTIEVFDVNGRRVRTLTRAEWQAGYHSVGWDALDAQGRRVTPGVYLYRMTAGSFLAGRKLVVLP